MTHQHQVPTQKELDAYIIQAKLLRTQALNQLAKRVFNLPAVMISTMKQSHASSHEPVHGSNTV